MPMSILYVVSILNIEDHAVTGLIVAALHLILFVLMCIGLLLVTGTICAVKSHIKYLYLLVIIIEIVLFSPTAIYYQFDELFLSAIVAITSFSYFTIISLFDSS